MCASMLYELNETLRLGCYTECEPTQVEGNQHELRKVIWEKMPSIIKYLGNKRIQELTVTSITYGTII